MGALLPWDKVLVCAFTQGGLALALSPSHLDDAVEKPGETAAAVGVRYASVLVEGVAQVALVDAAGVRPFDVAAGDVADGAGLLQATGRPVVPVELGPEPRRGWMTWLHAPGVSGLDDDRVEIDEAAGVGGYETFVGVRGDALQVGRPSFVKKLGRRPPKEGPDGVQGRRDVLVGARDGGGELGLQVKHVRDGEVRDERPRW